MSVTDTTFSQSVEFALPLARTIIPSSKHSRTHIIHNNCSSTVKLCASAMKINVWLAMSSSSPSSVSVASQSSPSPLPSLAMSPVGVVATHANNLFWFFSLPPPSLTRRKNRPLILWNERMKMRKEPPGSLRMQMHKMSRCLSNNIQHRAHCCHLSTAIISKSINLHTRVASPSPYGSRELLSLSDS